MDSKANIGKAAVVCALICSVIPLSAVQGTVLNSCDQWANYCSGDYCVYNDVWGPNGTWSQCIVAESTTQWYVDANHPSTGGVKSYPNSSYENVGQMISALGTLTSTVSTSSPGLGTGNYNTAWDIWAPTEIMIWINKYGAVGPWGSYVETASIGGTTWDVYKDGYPGFLTQSNYNGMTVDIKAILDYCVTKGWLNSSNTVGQVQCGFEISGTGGVSRRFTMNSYSVSYTISGTIPAAPSNLTATAASSNYINLSWSDDANNETGFYVERKTSSGGTYSQIASLGANVTGYQSTGLSASTTYYYRVRAYNGLGSSAYSNEAGATTYSGSGTILREWWTGIPGTAVSDLTSSGNYPGHPNGRELITKLEGPTNWADNYGTRIRGYLHPPADGNYTFWIASDANSELWLSTDDDPCYINKIAYVPGSTNSREWTKHPEQKSSPVSLAAFGKYYIEVLHKEADGNDNVAVAWGDDPNQQVIDGVFLSPCCLDFRDFAHFAAKWRLTNCNAGNSWCSGADFNHNGSVTLDDLKLFAESWLDGVE
jgi:hypothetical protein